MSHRTLVIAYSYSGTCNRVAQMLSGLYGWDGGTVFEVEPRPAGAWGAVRCVVDSLLRRRPAIRYEGPAPEAFETVVLVAPVWARRLASPMRSFIVDYRDRLPRVAVVSVMGGEGALNAFSEIGGLIGRTPDFSIACTAREVDDGSCASKLQSFGAAIQALPADGGTVVRPAVWSPRAV